VIALAAGVFAAMAAAGVAQAQTIYLIEPGTPTPSMNVGNACTTTTYVDGFGNTTSYLLCTPSYTIQYTPGYEEYYFYNP
jgi:hypothetical protein